jgi:pyruvate/2-oxoglutarate dehydrogenase complex dihydrolipoamide dehydrogenase (E3) component
MGEALTVEICVIGAGSGGIAAATAAAACGAAVVLVEKGEMGGAHLNAGSLAAAALIASARKAQALSLVKPFGLSVPRPKIDSYQVHDHIRGVIDAAAPNAAAARLTGLGVRVIQGTGCFKDARTLAVGEDIAITARRFIIATGAAPAIPSITGLKETPYLTSETIFDLLIYPKHLVVIGATPRGLALAQAFRRLGAEVTVLEAGPPLAREDAECAAVVLDRLEREGIALRANVNVARIKPARTKVHIFLGTPAGEEKIEASHLLIAAGRAPNVDALNLGAAGIKYGRDGIVVDAHLRTSNKRVYAVGDVLGGAPSDALAKQQAEAVVRHALFRKSDKANAGAVPRVTYTDPELAHVGLTESDARQAGRSFRVLRWPYAENDRARAERETEGHIKVITDRRGQILGATIVGTQASELIGTWTLAISQALNIRALADLVLPVPSYSEVGKEAAASYFVPAPARSAIRRLLGLLRLFG